MPCSQLAEDRPGVWAEKDLTCVKSRGNEQQRDEQTAEQPVSGAEKVRLQEKSPIPLLRLAASPCLVSAEGIDWDSGAGTRSTRDEELLREERRKACSKALPARLSAGGECCLFVSGRLQRKRSGVGGKRRKKTPSATPSAGDLERSESFKHFSLCRVTWLGVRAGRIAAGASEMSAEQ